MPQPALTLADAAAATRAAARAPSIAPRWASCTGVLDRLRTAGEPGALAPGEHVLRAALVTLFLADRWIPRDGVAGRIAPWDAAVRLHPGALAQASGLQLPVIRDALDWLRTRGALVPVDGEDPETVRLAPWCYAVSTTADGVAWDRVADLLTGDSSAMLVAWAMADVLPWADAYAPVTNDELQARTTLKRQTVKAAVARLESLAILERTGKHSFRFGTPVTRSAAAPAAPSAAPSTDDTGAPTAAPPAAPTGLLPPPVVGATAEQVTISVAGIPVTVPKHTTFHVKPGEDGFLVMRFE